MTRAAYTGHEVLTFSDYTDLDTGRTLTAEPGGTYDVAPAGGRPVPDIPEGWFTPLYGEVPEAAADIPAGEAADEPAGEPEASSEGEAADG